ncbi:MAG: prephenate dehydratase [Anaerolineae bacterium]|nr:prephenate dehydratase [Anaerolineae bacterium]
MGKIVVAFQGEHGAYSEEAVYQHFPRDTETLPCHSLKEIFEAIESGRATHGMLPIENSTAGSINQSYDLLLEYDLKIWAEVILRVRHCLLANPGTSIEQIRRVRSHPQALAQCERYIASHNFEPISYYDTAGSARELAENPQPDMAAIASRLAGEMYGLQVLDSDIEDLRFNYTRFFVLGTEDPPRTEHSKTSVVFATRHVPRALYTCLGEFAERDINLTKLESRPRRNKPWHYLFYLDFEGHWQEPHCEKALLGLLRRAAFVKVLGSYPAAPMPAETDNDHEQI